MYDKNRYWALMYRDKSGDYGLSPQRSRNRDKVAVLDMNSMACIWMDYEWDSTVKVHGLSVRTDFMTLDSFCGGDGTGFVRRSDLKYDFNLYGRLYQMQLCGDGLYCNGIKVVPRDISFCTRFNVMLFCKSFGTTYRIGLYINDNSMSGYLNLWLDAVAGGIVAYRWGMGTAGNVKLVPGYPDIVYQRLQSGFAESSQMKDRVV